MGITERSERNLTMKYPTDDVRIKNLKEVLPPIALMERFPITEQAARTVFDLYCHHGAITTLGD